MVQITGTFMGIDNMYLPDVRPHVSRVALAEGFVEDVCVLGVVDVIVEGGSVVVRVEVEVVAVVVVSEDSTVVMFGIDVVVVVVSGSVTIITLTIVVCTWQWYGYKPGLTKVKLNDDLAGRTVESKRTVGLLGPVV